MKPNGEREITDELTYIDADENHSNSIWRDFYILLQGQFEERLDLTPIGLLVIKDEYAHEYTDGSVRSGILFRTKDGGYQLGTPRGLIDLPTHKVKELLYKHYRYVVLAVVSYLSYDISEDEAYEKLQDIEFAREYLKKEFEWSIRDDMYKMALKALLHEFKTGVV